MTEQERREGLAFRRAVEQAGFARLSHLVVTDQELSDGAVRLYARLLYYARQDIRCWPGRQRLADDLGVSTQTIERRLAELVERGLITREQRGFGQTAMTWIEDLADVYAGEAVDNSSPLKNEEASPLKNEEAIAPSNLRGKEETEEEATAGGGANTKDIQTKTTTLTAFGVAKTVAERLAQERSLEDVHGWIDYARRADGLQNPAAFVVARLRDGEDPPDNDTDNEADERHRYAEWLQQ